MRETSSQREKREAATLQRGEQLLTKYRAKVFDEDERAAGRYMRGIERIKKILMPFWNRMSDEAANRRLENYGM